MAPDCGLKYLPRDVAFGKLKAMVDGAAIVRRELAPIGLITCERRPRTLGQRYVMRVQRHGDHGVVADQRRELYHPDHPATLQRPPIGCLRHGLGPVQLFGVVEDDQRLGIRRHRALAGADILDDGVLQPGFARHLLVDVPFEIAIAVPGRDQDRELGQPRRQRGAIAQDFSELLPFVGKLRAMERGAQRPLQPASRTGNDRLVDALLLGRHAFGRRTAECAATGLLKRGWI